MADFKKLDEYLKDAEYNMLNALSSALNLDINIVRQLCKSLTIKQETDIVMILDDDTLSKLEKSQRVHDYFTEIGLLEDSDPFNGVDLAGGYNFKCVIVNTAGRNLYMDWLEKNNYEYLIDNKGRFAVKCDSREDTYKAERAMDACKRGKWDKPTYGTNVDPDTKQPGLKQTKQPALVDDVNFNITESQLKWPNIEMHSFFDAIIQEMGEDGHSYDAWETLYNIVEMNKTSFTPDDLQWVDENKDNIMAEFARYGLQEGIAEAKKKVWKNSPSHDSKRIVGGENPAIHLSDPQFRRRVEKLKNKYDAKKERQRKIVDETSDAIGTQRSLGMSDMPSLGRMLMLAGINKS